MRYVLIDGAVVERREASVHVSDLGLRRGHAVFEFFRVVAGVPLFLDDHLGRLARSAELADLPLPHDRDGLRTLVERAIDVNDLGDAALQLLLTGGPSEDGFTVVAPSLIVVPVAVPPVPTAPEPATLITHEHVRELPEAKGTNYLTAMRLARTMRRRGAIDVVYHQGGWVSEAARSALAIVADGVLVTPAAGVLKSVSMTQMLASAPPELAIERRSYTLDELFGADEAVTTGSIRGVVPIVAIDDRPIGDGAIGPHSRALFAAFDAHVRAYVEARSPASRAGSAP